MSAKPAAFAVHALTATGALWALMALLAAARGAWDEMFLWLGLALAVDAADGPLARRLDVSRTLPRWSGEVLDLVIDFATYVLIPAFALASSGLMPGWTGAAAGGAVVLIGAFYFADMRMKTDDGSFEGFPGCWNMVVFVAFALQPPPGVLALVVAVLGALSFAPVRFVHPVRTVRLRPLTLAVTALWSGAALVAVLEGLTPPAWAQAALAATTAYLLAAGAVMQLAERRAAS